MEILLVSGPAPHDSAETAAAGLVEAQQRLRKMVLDTLPSPNSRRNYAKALDDLFAFSAGRPLTRALVMEYRASIEALSACCIDPLNSHPLPYRKVDRKELVSMGNETLFA